MVLEGLIAFLCICKSQPLVIHGITVGLHDPWRLTEKRAISQEGSSVSDAVT